MGPVWDLALLLADEGVYHAHDQGCWGSANAKSYVRIILFGSNSAITEPAHLAPWPYDFMALHEFWHRVTQDLLCPLE